MNIRPVQESDAAEWLRMRMALWPDSESDTEADEIAHFLAVPPLPPLPMLHAAFVCERPEGGLCGMAETSIRPYADGCDTTNVGYLEGWYVDPDVRGQGVGRALVVAAETWAREQGCREMASDAELDNIISQAAHGRLGYRETGRGVQFCKVLDGAAVRDNQAVLPKNYGIAQRYVRIYTDASGESHFEDVEVALSPIPGTPLASPILISPWISADQLAFVRCPPSESGDWQTTLRRQFLFLLAGENETEVSDGEVRRFGPGSIVLFENTTGKGHKSRFVGSEDALLAIVEVPD